jgi:acyl-CoA thioesterase-1
MFLRVGFLILSFLVALPGAGKEPLPVFVPPTDTPGLPRVLLIGDSISMGYTLPVRRLLAGEANVHRPPTNCGPTSNGLQNLDAWLGDRPWAVIHFNFGLHDLKYMDAQGKLVAVEKGRQQIPLAEYEANLRTLVTRLKATGARLIWCSTTPVPLGAQGRIPGSENEYNAAAARVMREAGVTIHDLHAFASAHLAEIQRPRDVHFTNPGSERLAQEVAAAIRRALAAATP